MYFFWLWFSKNSRHDQVVNHHQNLITDDKFSNTLTCREIFFTYDTFLLFEGAPSWVGSCVPPDPYILLRLLRRTGCPQGPDPSLAVIHDSLQDSTVHGLRWRRLIDDSTDGFCPLRVEIMKNIWFLLLKFQIIGLTVLTCKLFEYTCTPYQINIEGSSAHERMYTK